MGGLVATYTIGAEFPAMIARANATEQPMATQLGSFEVFTVFCPANIDLNRNDIITAKGKYYRLTDEELDPPKNASFSDHQYKAVSIEVV